MRKLILLKAKFLNQDIIICNIIIINTQKPKFDINPLMKKRRTCERMSIRIESRRHRSTTNRNNSYITIGDSDSNETKCDELFRKIP
jgi:hypothetical protein